MSVRDQEASSLRDATIAYYRARSDDARAEDEALSRSLSLATRRLVIDEPRSKPTRTR